MPQGGSWEPSDSSLTFSFFPVQWCQQSPRCITVNLELTHLWRWQWMGSPVRPRRRGSELGAPSFSGMRSSFCKRVSSLCSNLGEREKVLHGGCGRSCFPVTPLTSLPLVPKALLTRCFYFIEVTERSLLAGWLQGQLCGEKSTHTSISLLRLPPTPNPTPIPRGQQ